MQTSSGGPDLISTSKSGELSPLSQLDDKEQTIVEAPPDTNKILTSTPNNVLKESSKFPQSIENISEVIKNNEALRSMVSEIEPEHSLETGKDKAEEQEDLCIDDVAELSKDDVIAEDSCDNSLENNTAFKRFVNLMEDAWTYTQSAIQSFIEEEEETQKEEETSEDSKSLKAVNEKDENSKQTPQINILPEEDEEHFVGFGKQSSGLKTGSAKLNFLRALQRHSNEHRDLAVSFRTGNNNMLRAMWKRTYLGSDSRLYEGESDTPSESSGVPQQQLDFDITPAVRITRSKGLPLKCDYVQRKTLEYKTYSKKSDLLKE